VVNTVGKNYFATHECNVVMSLVAFVCACDCLPCLGSKPLTLSVILET